MSVIAGYVSSEKMPTAVNFDANHNATEESEESSTSPQKTTFSDDLSLKANTVSKLRRSSRRLFGRPQLEKPATLRDAHNDVVKEKPVISQTTKPRQVEIIYNDGDHKGQLNDDDSIQCQQEAGNKKMLQPSSDGAGERPSSTASDESVTPSSPVDCLVDSFNCFGGPMSSTVSTNICSERVACVLKEMIETERAYVKSLQEIIKGYVTHMRKHTLVSKQRVNALFMNMEDIHKFNREFLVELEECIANPVEVAYKFVLKGEGFEETYTEYCTKYPKAVEVLTELTRNRETASYLQKIQAKLGHSLPLGSYMLKPVQRILKYHLLWQDIKKHYAEEDDPEGYDLICDALLAMTNVATYINEMKRKHEVTLHVQEIQSQLSDFEGPDLTTYGDLVLEDNFRMSGTKTERYLILFEKIILITKRRESGFMCKATLMLSNMMLSESIPKEPLSFQIIRFNNQKITYTFVARNMKQKQEWTLAIKTLILESLTAQVPAKAKTLILGNKSLSPCPAEPRKRQRAKSEVCRPNLALLQPPKGHGKHVDSPGKEETDEEKPDSDAEKEGRETGGPAELPFRDNEATGEPDTFSSDDSKQEEKNHGNEPFTDEKEGVSGLDQTGPESIEEEAEGEVTEQDQNEDSFPRAENETSEDSTQSAGSEQRDERTQKTRRSVSVGSMRRERPQSYTEAPASQEAKGAVPFDGVSMVRELERLGATSIRERRLVELKRTWSLSAGATDRASSASDLTALNTNTADLPALPLEGITGNSTIKRTMRKLSQAFSQTDASPTDRSFSPPLQESSKLPDTGYPQAPSTDDGGGDWHGSLDDILASVERDIDETRRTINSAQLLESALRIKQNASCGVDTSVEVNRRSADLLDMKLRAMERMKKHRERILESSIKREQLRPKEFILEPAEATSDGTEAQGGDHVSDHAGNHVKEHVVRRTWTNETFQQLLQNANARSTELQEIHSHTLERMKKRKELLREDRLQRSRSEVFCTQSKSTKIFDFSSSFHEKSRPVAENGPRPQATKVAKEECCSEATRELGSDSEETSGQRQKARKRIIDIFVEPEVNDETDLAAETAPPEEIWPITPQKCELPNVRNIARQYSRLIHGKENGAAHAPDGNTAGSLKPEPSRTLQVERVTKVTLESCPSSPSAESKVGRCRLQRRPARRRRGSDEKRRSSWSCDQDKAEGQSGKKARPRSEPARKASREDEAVALSEENAVKDLENIEEVRSEPKEEEHSEQEAFFVRGRVQHLVNMFENPCAAGD